MRHQRRKGRLGKDYEERTALLRGLARGMITHKQIVTTHAKAKETSKFMDGLITLGKKNTLHARRQLVQRLGSGTEDLAKTVIDTIAPKFVDRQGGYTRVLHYKKRAGDNAPMSVLEFTVPVVQPTEKKSKKKKAKAPKAEATETTSTAIQSAPEAKKTQDIKQETAKKGGFLGKLRGFLKGDEDKK